MLENVVEKVEKKEKKVKKVDKAEKAEKTDKVEKVAEAEKPEEVVVADNEDKSSKKAKTKKSPAKKAAADKDKTEKLPEEKSPEKPIEEKAPEEKSPEKKPSSKSPKKTTEKASEKSPVPKTSEKLPEKQALTFKFNLQNRNSEALTKEIQLAEEKKGSIEKVTFQFELQNINDKKHQDKEFAIEALFSASDDEKDDAYFTIGNTVNYKPSAKKIAFTESFDCNFLFARTNKIKLIVYCSDGTKSEVTVNIAKVIKSKLAPCSIPINLSENSKIDFAPPGKEIKKDDKIQILYVTFKRQK